MGRDSPGRTAWQAIHPVFGRLMCWMLFSAGAELLAKGVCLYAGIDFRRPQCVPAYPHGVDADELEAWSRGFVSNWRARETIHVTDYGTLGGLDSTLRQLATARKFTHAQKQLLLAAYKLLAKSIRNRDAHAYVPHVRDQHFSLVPQLFVKCFDLLVAPLPISEWQNSADMLVKEAAAANDFCNGSPT